MSLTTSLTRPSSASQSRTRKCFASPCAAWALDRRMPSLLTITRRTWPRRRSSASAPISTKIRRRFVTRWPKRASHFPRRSGSGRNGKLGEEACRNGGGRDTGARRRRCARAAPRGAGGVRLRGGRSSGAGVFGRRAAPHRRSRRRRHGGRLRFLYALHSSGQAAAGTLAERGGRRIHAPAVRNRIGAVARGVRLRAAARLPRGVGAHGARQHSRAGSVRLGGRRAEGAGDVLLSALMEGRQSVPKGLQRLSSCRRAQREARFAGAAGAADLVSNRKANTILAGRPV